MYLGRILKLIDQNMLQAMIQSQSDIGGCLFAAQCSEGGGAGLGMVDDCETAEGQLEFLGEVGKHIE